MTESPSQNLEAELRALFKRAADHGPEVVGQLLRVAQELAESRPASEVGAANPAVPSWHGMIGESAPMLALRESIEKFARAKAPVLLRGESGVGKDVVARLIHRLGPRVEAPFLAENCAAIPENLLESVLFGHKRGSFTGAVRDHEGHFLAANKGTLFLDEIGDTPLSMQAKLLRVLQEGEVRAVGSEKIRKVDVRVVAATNRDLEAMVKEGTFREDLYYRLCVLTLEIPPLRERGDDILHLASTFLAEGAGGAPADQPLRLDRGAEEAFLGYPWPGNIRQLQNETRRLTALCDGPEISLEDLSEDIRAGRLA
ncbi:MAG: sigma-54 dependent transcriptional regulator [Planctomycetota bacterium]